MVRKECPAPKPGWRCWVVVGWLGRAVPRAPCARRFTFPPESVSLGDELAMATTTDKTSPHGDWTPTSWQTRQAAQQPIYPDPDALHRALGQLAKLPPLVTSWEIENLKSDRKSVV